MYLDYELRDKRVKTSRVLLTNWKVPANVIHALDMLFGKCLVNVLSLYTSRQHPKHDNTLKEKSELINAVVIF